MIVFEVFLFLIGERDIPCYFGRLLWLNYLMIHPFQILQASFSRHFAIIEAEKPFHWTHIRFHPQIYDNNFCRANICETFSSNPKKYIYFATFAIYVKIYNINIFGKLPHNKPKHLINNLLYLVHNILQCLTFKTQNGILRLYITHSQRKKNHSDDSEGIFSDIRHDG